MIKNDRCSDVTPSKRNRCYIQARNFFFAAKRCGRTEECTESGIPQSLPIPEYVNIAFSCELYLKTLLYKGEEQIKKHELIELFNLLDVKLQNKLSYDLEMSIEAVRDLLRGHSKLFQEMRYRFESSQYGEGFSVPLQFFYSLAKSLDRLAQETIGVVPYPSTNVNIDYFPELSMELYF